MIAIAIPLAIKVHMKIEHDELVKIATSEKANKVYRQFLKKNWDKNAFTSKGVIKTYKIDKNSVSQNPMGGFSVDLIINNDNKLIVYTNIDSFNDGHTLENGVSSCTSKLNDLLDKNNE